MEYTTAKKTAEKWGVSVTAVYRDARAGRIPGAELINGTWRIPEDAENPTNKLIAPKTGYISTQEAAEKWGIRADSVCDAAKEGRIPGAELVGGRWHIPKDAKEPINKRTARLPGYTSVSKTAEKWGISQNTLLCALREGRIPDAEFIDGRWHIPEGAQGITARRKKLR